VGRRQKLADVDAPDFPQMPDNGRFAVSDRRSGRLIPAVMTDCIITIVDLIGGVNIKFQGSEVEKGEIS